ncbi:MAG: patatin-like phospholipase family protein [Chroococcidiopsidaceae cyanobacterium CP_BM_RX_35]|nr:patatin-like phospholipase family protein [Chroococcidiopsidaceae cyanobacterium CP_BM_RX_35]
MTLLERLTSKSPKRILALDGGGIRGILTIGSLEKIEQLLRQRHQDPQLKLCDYFDLIGGTSTGAIIASGLAIGMEVAELKQMYLELGGRIFGKRSWRVLQARFDQGPLNEELAKVFGDRTLGDDSIRTGLCIIAKRADTGSTWPLTNHPDSKYYNRNSQILLRQAVRASTAAPTYFVPEKFDIGNGEIGAFVDGGVSMANNPALQLFLIATLKGFPFRWSTGEHRLLLVSVGTGSWHHHDTADNVVEGRMWNWATQVPSMLMNDANWQGQLLLQYLSNTSTPWEIDREVGNLASDLLTPEPALSYLRYDVRLEANALNALGLTQLSLKLGSLRDMSAGENRYNLTLIGEKAAEQQVQDEHFSKAFDLSVQALSEVVSRSTNFEF